MPSTIEPIYLGIAIALFVFLEAGLFWASASLGDAPVLSWLKITLIGVGVALLWLAILGWIAWQLGLSQATLAPENQLTGWFFLAITLILTWAIPAVLYAPLVPLPLLRSMRVAVFQVLLRAFTYALLAAVGFVALAILQIWTGADVRAILLP